jgi:hypothetical protein
MAKKKRFGSMTEMEDFFVEQGRKGGKAAAANLSQEQRSARAKKAGEASARAKKAKAKAKE